MAVILLRWSVQPVAGIAKCDYPLRVEHLPPAQRGIRAARRKLAVRRRELGSNTQMGDDHDDVPHFDLREFD
jgi:hypothetical protein